MQESTVRMSKDPFEQQLKVYDDWKTQLIHTIEKFQPWLEERGLCGKDSENRIRKALDSLKSDRLTIAFVAEFSRGKTELINAIFFADQGRRLLPSTAGRTTMCPTELFYDDAADESYIRLLPIETRLQDDSVAEFKEAPEQWVQMPLDIQSPQQMEEMLQEVVGTKTVSVDEARQLGLPPESTHGHRDRTPTHIEIPKWRHALISFPHPLLKQGLTILDTPGLNALGTEPELTINLLPSAQAILFVLAADAGVTQSDLDMWREHIKRSRNDLNSGLMVVLNKIDVLWDDLQQASSVELAVQQQQISVAKILNVAQSNIFPVSAQKALLAKVRGDETLLHKSALPALEEYLSNDLLDTKQQIIQDMVTSEVGQILENARSLINGKRRNLETQLGELGQLRGKSDNAIQHLLQQTRDEQASYLSNLENFQASRRELGSRAEELLQILDLDRLDQTIKGAYKQMSFRWTTFGLRLSIKGLFDLLRADFQTVVEHSEKTRKLVRNVYRRFQKEHGFTVMQPTTFSIMKHRVDLELLSQEAEAFSSSALTAATEQSFVVKRFFLVIVKRAREIFQQARQETDTWLATALEPLARQIVEHKKMTEQRLQNLQKLGKSRNTLQARIADLQKEYESTTRLLSTLNNMNKALNINSGDFNENAPSSSLASVTGGAA